jgi:lipopolysaccharide transport system ATP-binding protein
MTNTAILVENLSKSYQLGVIGTGTFRGDLQRWWARVRGRPDPYAKIGEADYGNRMGETIWALKDVNFQASRGEAVGIIGRNGAGKSTLLKILSQVTAPTSGMVRIKGHIASLLEVGTGFHPELTGRENIFLNGAIMGMDRREILRKFDEIVDFSGVEQFIDTPVKRYSSGMYVRLAFAVAAHLEPDILVVDEVLAVGDAEFQKKCLGKMEDVAKQGRTVLFVSHNMAAISALCSKAMVLKKGRVEFELNDSSKAIMKYLSQVNEITQFTLSDRKDRQGQGKIIIDDFKIFDQDNNLLDIVLAGQSIELRIDYHSVQKFDPRNISAGLSISSPTGGFVAVLGNEITAGLFPTIPQKGCIKCCIPKFPLAAGSYTLNLIIHQNGVIEDWIQEAAVLNVENGDYYGTGRIPSASQSGLVFFEQKWTSLSRE